MLLAGDIGGTNTRLGLFERGDPRPRPVAFGVYPTRGLTNLATALGAFLQEYPATAPIAAAAVGVAAPVAGGRAKLTNGTWAIDSADIAPFVRGPVVLLNDLECLARSVPLLADADLVVLQAGTPVSNGPRAVIAAGTGLGQAFLPSIEGRPVSIPSEAGHADFAARTDREIDLVRALRAQFGRVEIEQVVSGPGIMHLHRFTHGTRACAVVPVSDAAQMPAAITASALERRCEACVEALGMFVEAFGAEAGNVALRGLTSGGVFVGGGIAPKILQVLQDGRFMAAFLDKAPMTRLLTAVPVHVIVNSDAALLGAAAASQAIA
jgi:glucokinase